MSIMAQTDRGHSLIQSVLLSLSLSLNATVKSKIHATGSETFADTIWLWQLLTHITHICMHSHTPTSMHSLSHTCMHSDTYMHTHQDNTVWHWRVCTPLKLLVKILYGGTLQSFTLCESLMSMTITPMATGTCIRHWRSQHLIHTQMHECAHAHTHTWHRHSFQPPNLA